MIRPIVDAVYELRKEALLPAVAAGAVATGGYLKRKEIGEAIESGGNEVTGRAKKAWDSLTTASNKVRLPSSFEDASAKVNKKAKKYADQIAASKNPEAALAALVGSGVVAGATLATVRRLLRRGRA